MTRNSAKTRRVLTAGQKASRTKGKAGHAVAAHKAAITRLSIRLSNIAPRSKERAAVKAAITSHKAALSA